MSSPEQADQRTCLVFGGTGFLGRAVVDAIRDAGLRVRIAARHAPRERPGDAGRGETGAAGRGEAAAAAGPPERLRGDDPVEQVRADVRDEQAVARAVRGAWAVVNAVSLYVETRAATFEEIHVEAAARVARQARDAGVQTLVHVSGLGADTGSPSKYVRARARGELAVREAFERAVAVRPSVLFGRGDAFLTNLAGLTRLPAVPLFGDGGTRLQPVHVADVAAAVAAAIRSPDPRSIYELGGPEVLTYREILRRVMDHLGRRRPLIPVPFGVWRAGTRVLDLLPSPPLTTDQVVLMQHDNIVSGDEPTFAELGLEPAGLGQMLPHCLPSGVSR